MDHSTHVKPSKIHIFWEAYLKCNTIVKNALKNDFVSNVVVYFSTVLRCIQYSTLLVVEHLNISNAENRL